MISVSTQSAQMTFKTFTLAQVATFFLTFLWVYIKKSPAQRQLTSSQLELALGMGLVDFSADINDTYYDQ